MDKKLEEIIKYFSKLFKAGIAINSEESFKGVAMLQNFLNEKFPCNIDALFSFADMYRREDFKKNIDTITCEGTAEYIASAIEAYCLEG